MVNNFVDRMESILTQIGNSFYDTFHQVHSSIWKAGLIYFSIPCTVYILYCFIELKVWHENRLNWIRTSNTWRREAILFTVLVYLFRIQDKLTRRRIKKENELLSDKSTVYENLSPMEFVRKNHLAFNQRQDSYLFALSNEIKF